MAKFKIVNLDGTASIKIEKYDVASGDLHQTLDASMIMPNHGTEGKEFEFTTGHAFLISVVEDSTLGGQRVIVNPDSQQNMVVTPVKSSVEEVKTAGGAVATAKQPDNAPSKDNAGQGKSTPDGV